MRSLFKRYWSAAILVVACLLGPASNVLGATAKVLVDTDSAQTLTNKTLTSPILGGLLKLPPTTTTMSADATLISSSATYQNFNPNGSDRIVTLPTAVDGMSFVINHIGSANTLTIKNAGGSTIVTVVAGSIVFVQYDATASVWRVLSTVSNPVVPFYEPGLRLTLASATPITISDVTAAGTIYYTPYKSGTLSYYSGTSWLQATISEISLALTLTSGKNYDAFASCSSATVCALSLSAAWTNDSTRADALGIQDGVTVLGSDHTKLWIGTIRASGTNTTEDSILKRFVWNTFNKEPRQGFVSGVTGHTYNSATFRSWNNDAALRFGFVIGRPQTVGAGVQAYTTAAAAGDAIVAFGVDSTSAAPNNSVFVASSAVTGIRFGGSTHFVPNAAGYHFYQLLESAQVSTSTFNEAYLNVQILN